MPDIMLDLETMGNGSNAAIIAIGAVKFDTVSRTVIDNPAHNGTFYRVVCLESSAKSGGKMDSSTVLWWLEQSPEARAAIGIKKAPKIEEVLNDFAAWINNTSCTGVWGNGSDFDNVILGNAYSRSGIKQPWTHSKNRCYRTMKNIPKARTIKLQRKGTHHHALDDAISQAQHLCDIMRELGL